MPASASRSCCRDGAVVTGVAPAQGRAGRFTGLVLFLILVELTSGMIQGFYTPALKLIAVEFDVTDAQVTYFQTVQTLAAAVGLPLLAKLGDVLGHRRMLRLAVVLVVVGALGTALAPTFELVLASRVLVGALAVWLPLEVALVHSRFTGEPARRTVGTVVAALTVGVVLGSLLSGVSTSLLDLRVALLVPALLGCVALYAVFWRLPETAQRSPRTLDVFGFVGLAAGMVLLLVALSLFAERGPGDVVPWLLLAAAAGVISAWVCWERYTGSPAVDVRMMTSRQLAPLYVAGFAFGFVILGFQTPLSTFAASDPDPGVDGYGFGLTSLMVSLLIAGFTVLASIGAATLTVLTRRLGTTRVLVGASLLAAAGMLAFAVAHSELWMVLLMIAPAGIGMGILLGALPALVAENTLPHSRGIGVGVYNMLRTLGGAVAGACSTFILTVTASSPDAATGVPREGSHATDAGYTVIWIVAAAAFVLCAIVLGASNHARRPTVPMRRADRADDPS